MAKILVVDDDPGILGMLQLMLRLEGYDAIVCGEPRLVVDTMASEKPDLVLLDALMPGLDGIQVLSHPGACTAHTVLLVTGNANELISNWQWRRAPANCWQALVKIAGPSCRSSWKELIAAFAA
jgi:DNA-binding NtrC family response regulator